MNKNITTEIYQKIAVQFDALGKSLEAAVQKTDKGWYLPSTSMRLFVPIDENIKPTDIVPTITIETINYNGSSFNDFMDICSRKLFYAIANHFTPENVVFEVFKKQADVDGYEGCCDDIKFFKKIGNSMEYAQSLIEKHFRNKTKIIDFPELYYQSPTSCLDSEAYASSVCIICHKTAD